MSRGHEAEEELWNVQGLSGRVLSVPAPGAVPGLPHGARHRPVRGRVLGLPRGPCAGGSCAETSAGGAPAPASGVLYFPCPELGCPGEGVLPPVPELLGQEGHGQSCAGASILFPWGAGMWSWEQPGRPWCVQGTASPTLLLLQGQAQAELRNQERFLLPPEPEALLAPWSALSAQEITFLLCFFQVLLVDGNGLLHPRGRLFMESPALLLLVLPLGIPVPWWPAATVAPCWQDLA